MTIDEPKQFYAAAGARIREARGKSVTQEQLARAAGLSRVSILNIEGGRQKLLLHHAIVIAHALGMSLTELVAPLMPKDDDKLDLSSAGDAEDFVRAALQNLTRELEPKLNQ